jgi:hypothetical protein
VGEVREGGGTDEEEKGWKEGGESGLGARGVGVGMAWPKDRMLKH